jgi:hypothetical protein
LTDDDDDDNDDDKEIMQVTLVQCSERLMREKI